MPVIQGEVGRQDLDIHRSLCLNFLRQGFQLLLPPGCQHQRVALPCQLAGELCSDAAGCACDQCAFTF